MKILYLVVCAEWQEHPALAEGVRATWGKDRDVWYLWGRDHTNLKWHDWVLNREESYGIMLWKVIKFLQAYTGWYDYVVKTNTGCYLDIPALKEWLKDKPTRRLYAGIKGHFHNEYDVQCDFVSGSCIIMSGDVARLMVACQKEFGPSYIDDVAIGMFAERHKIPITEGIRTTNPAEQSYHYYLRHGDGERYKDVETMKYLYERTTIRQ
jgi:hypothetical protein